MRQERVDWRSPSPGASSNSSPGTHTNNRIFKTGWTNCANEPSSAKPINETLQPGLWPKRSPVLRASVYCFFSNRHNTFAYVRMTDVTTQLTNDSWEKVLKFPSGWIKLNALAQQSHQFKHLTLYVGPDARTVDDSTEVAALELYSR